VDAEEDARFRVERSRALQRRQQLRAFVERQEQARLEAAQAWLDNPSRPRVPAIDGPGAEEQPRLEGGRQAARIPGKFGGRA
jgi:hypothetical protein